MRCVTLLAALLLCSTAQAQQVSTSLGTSASQSAVTALQSQVSAIQASMPQPASSVPPSEAVGGAAGAATTYRRGDAIQPRITRSKTVTTAADGTATFDWSSQGALTATPQLVLSPVYTGAAVPSCWGTAVSTTAASIKCTVQVTVTVVGISVLGAPTPASGLSVGVIALPPS